MALSLQKRDRKLLAWTLVFWLLAPRPSAAMFGLPGLPQLVNDWKANISLGKLVLSNRTTAEKLIAMKDLAADMSRMYSRSRRMNWMTALTVGVRDYTENRWNETRGWGGMITGNPMDAGRVVRQVSVMVQPTAPRYVTGNQMQHLATVEIAHGSMERCLAITANYRRNAEENLESYQSLDGDTLDESSDSYGEQLNLLNARQMQAANESRSQGQIAACEVEQAAIQNKMQADVLAESLNTSIEKQRAHAERPTMMSDSTDVVMSWIPQ